MNFMHYWLAGHVICALAFYGWVWWDVRKQEKG